MPYLGGRSEMKFTSNLLHYRLILFEQIYSEITDIYSYGMVLFEMFSGKLPFQEITFNEVN
jgi:serine/threonine protein kinase